MMSLTRTSGASYGVVYYANQQASFAGFFNWQEAHEWLELHGREGAFIVHSIDPGTTVHAALMARRCGGREDCIVGAHEAEAYDAWVHIETEPMAPAELLGVLDQGFQLNEAVVDDLLRRTRG